MDHLMSLDCSKMYEIIVFYYLYNIDFEKHSILLEIGLANNWIDYYVNNLNNQWLLVVHIDGLTSKDYEILLNEM
jgi:hypothetical protein